jgi:hypothetical protein
MAAAPVTERGDLMTLMPVKDRLRFIALMRAGHELSRDPDMIVVPNVCSLHSLHHLTRPGPADEFRGEEVKKMRPLSDETIRLLLVVVILLRLVG